MKPLTFLSIVTLLTGAAFAQSTIDFNARHAYAANTGWLELYADKAHGLVVGESFLRGSAYAGNFGWLDFGDGSPDNGYAYSNASKEDCGVNLAADGALSGYAYSGNIGWVRFEQSFGKPRLNWQTGAFHGHAYSGNLGWIALDTIHSDLGTKLVVCADSDGDGIGDAYEMRFFGELTVMDATSDFDRDGQSDAREYRALTDPLDPDQWLRVETWAFAGDLGDLKVTFPSQPGRLYRIDLSADLIDWQPSALGIFAPNVGATTTRFVATPASERLFIRVTAVKPLQ